MRQQNGSTYLCQYKSTTIARHESIDPDISRHEAYTAANLAFNRASGLEHRDDEENAQAKVSSKFFHGKSQKFRTKSERIKRQQSIRFTGPSAARKRQLIQNRTKRNPMKNNNSSSSLTLVAMSSSAVFPEINRPLSQAASTRNISESKAKAMSHIPTETCNTRSTENCNSKRIWQSASSPYRRIRKSKSGFDLPQTSNLHHSDDMPDGPEINHRTSTSPFNPLISHIQISRSTLRPPKSMSLLLEKRQKNEENDMAVQLAQDRFFHDTSQQLSQKKSSFLHPSQPSRREKIFRKSTHSSITNADLPYISSTQNQNSKESGFKSAAFKASRSLGNKFKKTFGLSKNDPIEIPNQQVDANQVNNRRFTRDSHLIYEMLSEIPHYDRASIARVVSRVPSICESASNAKVKSHAGSIKSFKTDASENDSLTASWTSADVNTIKAQGSLKLPDQVEQCLSMINETDSQIFSSPAPPLRQGKLVNQLPNYSPTQPQCKSMNDRSPAPISVNSARVYSALMKRINLDGLTSRKKASNLSKSDQSIYLKESVAELNNSEYGCVEKNKDFATIRQVSSEFPASRSNKSRFLGERDNFSINTDSTHLTQEEILSDTDSFFHQKVGVNLSERTQKKNNDLDNNFYSGDSLTEKQKIPSPREHLQEQKSFPINPSIRKTTQRPRHNFLQEVSIQNQCQNLGDPFLDERDNIIKPQSTSSLQQKIENSSYDPLIASPEFLHSGNDKLDETPRCATFAHSSGQNMRCSAYTESIYSCATNGQAYLANSSSWSLPLEKATAAGISFPSTPNGRTMKINQDVCNSKILTSEDNFNHSTSSIEWKTRILPAATEFESKKENARCLMYPVSRKPQRKINIPTSPLAIVQQIDPNIQYSPSLRPTGIKETISSTVMSEESSKHAEKNLHVKNSHPQPEPAVYTLDGTKVISPIKSMITIHTPNSTNNLSNVTQRNRLYYRNISNSALQSVTLDATPRDSVKLQRRFIIRPVSPMPSPTKGTTKQRNTTSSGSNFLDSEPVTDLGSRKNHQTSSYRITLQQ